MVICGSTSVPGAAEAPVPSAAASAAEMVLISHLRKSSVHAKSNGKGIQGTCRAAARAAARSPVQGGYPGRTLSLDIQQAGDSDIPGLIPPLTCTNNYIEGPRYSDILSRDTLPKAIPLLENI